MDFYLCVNREARCTLLFDIVITQPYLCKYFVTHRLLCSVNSSLSEYILLYMSCSERNIEFLFSIG